MTKTLGWVAVVVVLGAVLWAVEEGRRADGPEPTPSTSLPTTPEDPPGVPTTLVPDVQGNRESSAERELRRAELTADTSSRYSNQPVGTVLVQRPVAGRQVDEGSTVSLVVAKAFPRVPNVMRKKLSSARRLLKRGGFDVRVVKQPSTAAEGSVTWQNPSGGTRARPGRTVTIGIATPTTDGSRTDDDLRVRSDYDCAGGTGDGPGYVYGSVRIVGADQYDLDADNDGVGCE